VLTSKAGLIVLSLVAMIPNQASVEAAHEKRTKTPTTFFVTVGRHPITPKS
jgi:hypothetical protein